MKKLSIALLLLLPQIYFAQLDRSTRPKAAAAPQINIKDSEVFTLANGLTVILSENHKIPKVTFSLTIGSDPKPEGNKAGLSELAGSLIASGTNSRDKDQLDKEIDYIGADFSADQKSIYLSCLTKHMEKGLTLMSDVLTNASFPQGEFERIVKQAEANLKSTKASADEMAENVLSKKLYPAGHPYNEIMTEATLANITNDDVKAYYKGAFIPKGAYLVIIGDINLDGAKKMAEKYFGSWKGGEPFELPKMGAIPSNGNQVIFAKKPGAVQSVIRVAFAVNAKPGDPDQIPLTVLNEIMGGGVFGSRLMQNLREKKAFTYGCRSNINFDEHGSIFSTSGSFRNDVSDSALTEIIYELKKITEEYVTDEELNLTKSSMAGSFARSLENPSTIARFALNIKRYGLPKDYYQTYLKRLEAITKEDILLMAQKYFNANNLNLILVGSETILDKLKPFDKDGKIELVDAFGDEAKEVRPADISADKLIENYVLATTKTSNLKAAAKKMKKIKSVTQEMELKSAQIPFALKMTRVWSAPNMEGTKLEGQGMVFQKTYFDGKTGGSSSMQTGKTEMKAEEIAAKQKSIGFLPEMNFKISGIKYEMVGIENLNGKDLYILISNDGNSEILSYYDKTNWMKVKEVTSVKEGEEVNTSEVNFGDFKEASGLMLPYKMTMSVGPMTLDGSTTAIKMNEKIDWNSFK